MGGAFTVPEPFVWPNCLLGCLGCLGCLIAHLAKHTYMLRCCLRRLSAGEVLGDDGALPGLPFLP